MCLTCTLWLLVVVAATTAAIDVVAAAAAVVVVAVVVVAAAVATAAVCGTLEVTEIEIILHDISLEQRLAADQIEFVSVKED